MKRIYVFLLLSILLISIFGLIIVEGVHQLTHYVSDAEAAPWVQNSEEGTSLSSSSNGYHDHGNGYHSHGFTLAALLKSFNQPRILLVLDDVRSTLLLILSFQSIIMNPTAIFSLLPSIIKKRRRYFRNLLNSAVIDIPTPPPRSVFS